MPIITSLAVREAQASGAMLVEAASLPRGFVQLPKLVLYAGIFHATPSCSMRCC